MNTGSREARGGVLKSCVLLSKIYSKLKYLTEATSYQSFLKFFVLFVVVVAVGGAYSAKLVA